MKRISFVPALLVVLGLSMAQAADIRRISLEGKDGVPAPVAEPGKDGIDRIHKVETPALELFPTAQKPSRGTIMVRPGGGYHILAINHEGYFVAKKLNQFGYDVAILLYHVSAGKQTRELALADAFVYVAADDKYAPSAIAYAAACREKKVPCAFTKAEQGGHGFGLKPVLPPDVKDWPDKLHAFLDGLK